jgi:hypothetical protein
MKLTPEQIAQQQEWLAEIAAKQKLWEEREAKAAKNRAKHYRYNHSAKGLARNQRYNAIH